ncbi:MAG: VCBS repeat-containing protein [Myxococcota bacterium]
MEHLATRFVGSLPPAESASPASTVSPAAGRLLRTVFAGALATLVASPAAAALREYRMQFQPSPSAGVTGYTMHLGTSSGNYQAQFDLGLPPASGGVVNYALDLEDSVELFVALRAYGSAGNVSAYSSEVHLTPIPLSDGGTGGGSTGGTGDSGGSGGSTGGTGDPGGSGGSTGGGGGDVVTPPPADPMVALGIATKTSTATLARLATNGSLSPLTMDSLTATGDVSATTCDLEGDGDRDLVIGFGDGSGGAISILTLENDVVVDAASIQAGTESYRSRAGQTIPACGDLDGDGRAELLVGFSGAMRGVVQVFDDVATGFAPMATARSDAEGFMQIPVPPRFNGSILPAIGDLDGDGRGEVVVGLTNTYKGLIVVLDDAPSGFGIHPVNRSGKPWYNIEPVANSRRSRAGGMTVPAMGDFDGDGRDEIVVGFGKGSRGHVALLDDASREWPSDPGDVFILRTGRADYQSGYGATRPSLGDIDEDGAAEIVVGFDRGGDSELQVFDDLAGMLKPIGPDEGFVASSDSSLIILPAPAR